jgi:hypothetical protein
MVVADPDELGDVVGDVLDAGHDLGLELDRPGLAGHMGPSGSGTYQSAPR